jgi:hypothetical protein
LPELGKAYFAIHMRVAFLLAISCPLILLGSKDVQGLHL